MCRLLEVSSDALVPVAAPCNQDCASVHMCSSVGWIYIYICMYVCMYVCICMWMYIYVCMYVYIYVCCSWELHITMMYHHLSICARMLIISKAHETNWNCFDDGRSMSNCKSRKWKSMSASCWSQGYAQRIWLFVWRAWHSVAWMSGHFIV